jgi:SAM-dependent methyltransferase
MFTILRRFIAKARFPGSASYWEQRYATGGNSGHGSYGKYAEFKAEFLNHFVAEHRIQSVVEFGCGDGNQLSLAVYPLYTGIDVSPTAIDLCSKRFQRDHSKSFFLAGANPPVQADLSISLDVTYHLIEDEAFSRYMTDLFGPALRFVIIYSSDPETGSRPDLHVRHRPISKYVAEHFPGWRLTSRTNNPYPKHPTENFAEFMVFERLPIT